MSETIDTTAVPTPGDEPVQPSLNVLDIGSAVRIIDHACDQGAFKGWELIRQVKETRDRLDAFVAAVTPPPSDETATETTPTTAPVTEPATA